MMLERGDWVDTSKGRGSIQGWGIVRPSGICRYSTRRGAYAKPAEGRCKVWLANKGEIAWVPLSELDPQPAPLLPLLEV